jgi:hypothetical protein
MMPALAPEQTLQCRGEPSYARPMKRVDVSVVVALLLCLGGCDAPPRPPTPDILQGLTIGREQFEMCPGADPNISWEIALSPELEGRLSRLAPPGASEQSVVRALAAQGFHPAEAPCSNDPSVHSATFFQQGGGGLSTYPVMADVYWRVDANSNIEWIHGTVSYLGP